ncbi:MAG: helix-turn-helix domain-containing protein [Candidatus Entotheonellia bacterium]
MGTSLQEKMAALDPARQARIKAETERLQAEYMTLQDLRKAREMTQVRLAEILGKSQVTVAQMEKRTDVMLSTLRSYIEAMGGQLDLVVRFPDREPVVLQGLRDDGPAPHSSGPSSPRTKATPLKHKGR